MSTGALVALGMMGIGPLDHLCEDDNEEEEEKDSDEDTETGSLLS